MNVERAIAALVQGMQDAYGQGRTDVPTEAGYVLPDGSLLAMGRHGDRMSDHREIIGLLMDFEAELPPHEDNRTVKMRAWMAHLGLVRMSLHGSSRRGWALDIEAAAPLTSEQRATVRGLLRQSEWAEVRRVLRGETEESLELDPPNAMTVARAMAMLVRPDTPRPEQVGRTLEQALEPHGGRGRR